MTDWERTRLATFRIGHELLAQMLRLPEGTEIVEVRRREELHAELEVVVWSPKLPRLAEGSPIPSFAITYRSVDGRTELAKVEHGVTYQAHLMESDG